MTEGEMHRHLTNRHLKPALYKGIVIDTDVVTFPLWNLSGQRVGYQQYRPNGSKQYRKNPKEGRYFTYISKDNPITAWGLDLLNPKDKTIYLTEGIFSACRFHNHGYNALATLGNDPKHLKHWLKCLGYNLVAICDGDKAGKKLAKYGHKSIQLRNGEYIDEMSEDLFILRLLSQLLIWH